MRAEIDSLNELREQRDALAERVADLESNRVDEFMEKAKLAAKSQGNDTDPDEYSSDDLDSLM